MRADLAPRESLPQTTPLPDAPFHLQLRGREDAALDAMRRLVESDTAPPVEVRDPSGTPLLRLGEYPAGWDVAEQGAARRAAVVPDSGGYGPLFVVDSAAYLWAAVPILDGDASVGTLAQLSRVGSPNTAAGIASLIGSGSQVFLANHEAAFWVRLDGAVQPPHTSLPAARIARFYGRDEQLEVVSRAGEGSRFTLLLPLPTPVRA